MVVYVGDNMHGALMIKKVGAQWHVHRLKQVNVSGSRGFHPNFDKVKKMGWEWEKTPMAKHGYKPYDDDDVMMNPNLLFKHVQRMAQHKVRWTWK